MSQAEFEQPKSDVVVQQHQLVFIGGLERSGTHRLALALAAHPLVSAFDNTGAKADEGQDLQSVYPSARAYEGASMFGVNPEAHLTEASSLVRQENRDKLLSEWGKYWDLAKPVLVEESSLNLVRTRFLQALFPDAYFLIMMRHPIAVALAVGNWNNQGLASLLEHWLACHERFADDRPHLRRVHVITYEDLIDHPQTTLDGVLSFLGLPPHPQQLHMGRERRIQARYMNTWSMLTNANDSGDRAELLNVVEKYRGRVKRFGYELSVPATVPIAVDAPSRVPGRISTQSSVGGPDFIIIGAQKAGTTALFSYLSRHPNVVPPSVKEIHFFDGASSRLYGIDSYRALFPEGTVGPDGLPRITGEATPYYMFHPRVPSMVAEHLRDVKLLVVLRNPADRAYSHYQMTKRRHWEHEQLSFEEAIDAEGQRLEGEEEKLAADPNYMSMAHRRFSYLARGIYVNQLMRWAKFFPREQILVLESRELLTRPAVALGRVYEFLGLPEHDLEAPKLRNAGSYKPVNPETRQRLVEYFAPHNRRLYDYLGVDFGWQ